MSGVRPAVSVCVPFHGDEQDARALLAALADVRLRGDDEIVLADNTADGVLLALAPAPPVRVVPARGEASSYHARNVAAGAARHDWLLFTDTDCRPQPDLVERYFDVPVADGTGAVVGAVEPLPDPPTFFAAYAITREAGKQAAHMAHPYKPFGVTANMLVRRAAYAAVGGFHEGIRSGGDCDFSWRLQDAGWELEYRAEALVRHEQRETLGQLLRLFARYGAGRRWVQARHPASRMRPRIAGPLARCAAGVPYWLVRRDPRRAGYKAIDAGVLVAGAAGALLGNTPPPRFPARHDRDATPRIALIVDHFPEVSETFVAAEARALTTLGADVRIEAHGRGGTPARELAVGLDVRYLEDTGLLRRAQALAWLTRHAPGAVLRDLVDRRRWRREETVLPLRALAPVARRLHDDGVEVLHAHFAAGAALSAMRLGSLLDRPWTLTAHGYDIFRIRRNLREKLARCAFATTGSDYTVAALRSHADPADADRIHRIVMGVDGEGWRRTTGHPDGGLVLAVGRLVGKKGFGDLLDAVALLGPDDGLQELVIVGAGPLGEELADRARRLGVQDRVRFAGARPTSEVRELLESAAVLAVPCVVAPDGDADSMPVIAKEALAMEVPVVASDAAGLPEIVDDRVGRRVRAGDPQDLARGLREVLALSPQERAALGRAGRERATGELGLLHQTGVLLDLLRSTVAARR